MTSICYLISCEHGGNEVPPDYAPLFSSSGGKRDLNSHRGYDPGSFDAATRLAAELGTSFISSTTTRLLVDLNRSLDNPQLFSKYAMMLSESERATLLSKHYHPYRQQITNQIASLLASNDRVIHLSMHTFTPRFRGTHRPLDVGILYDPSRAEEKKFSEAIVNRFASLAPHRRVRHNEPYLGIDDGLTTYLRTQHPSRQYVGIEIEINNRYARWQETQKQKMITQLAKAIQDDSPDF